MVTFDLPPESVVAAEPTAPKRPRARKRTDREQWRHDTLIKQLLNPTIVAETALLLEQQANEVFAAFKPRNGWQDWLASTIATLIIRINRSERIERKLRDYASYRALDFWEDDQKLAVETIATRIARDPAKVVAQLRATPAGVDWLLARWQILARVEATGWGDDLRTLAAHLTGNDAAVDPAAPGFVAGRITALAEYRDRVAEADTIARGLVEADLNDDAVPNLAKLRRYVRSLHRQLKWYVDQFHVEHPDRWDDPARRPAIYGPAVEEYRPRNPNHFEGKEHFAPAEPTPPAATADHEINETKPPSPPSTHENNETKPTPAASVERKPATKPSAPAPAPFSIEPPVVVHDYSNERGRNHSRALRPGEHSREYARRVKAARRRTNLALAELT